MKTALKIFTILILIIADLGIWFKAFEPEVLNFGFITSQSAAVLSTTMNAFPNTQPSPSQKTYASLQEAVNKSLEGTTGTYAVVVKNLKTGESYATNEAKIYEPASLYKLWVMATVYDQIKAGALKKDQFLSRDVSYLNERFQIDPEDAELKDGVISGTVTELLDQMITISHNYAALLLSEKIRNTSIESFLSKNGFVVSDLGVPPKTNASEVAMFLEKLYKGEIVSKEYSLEMIEIMKKQELNNGLPKDLPSGTVIAHKTGEIGWYKHDAGIVYTPQGDYLIVVLSESNAPLAAQDRIATISKAVYDYF